MPNTTNTPELGAYAVLDGYRYVVAQHLGDGTTLLEPADDSHDRVTAVRTAELTHESALGVWTLPGRLFDKSGALTVNTEDNV